MNAICACARRASASLAILGVVMALHASSAAAVNSTPCTSPIPWGSASGARIVPPSTCSDPNQTIYDQLRARLGGDLSRALTTQQHLALVLDQTMASEQALTDQISQEMALIANLQNQVSQVDAQIADTQNRIDSEKAQLAALARAIYRQPDSFWLLIARAGNLRDALLATSDLVIAGERAHTLQSQLEADLATFQTNRDARQAALDRESSVRDSLVSSQTTLTDLMNQQNDVSNQLATLITEIRDAAAAVGTLPPDVTASLAQLLEQEEQDLMAKAYQEAWNQAAIGSGLAIMTNQLPVDQTLAGLIITLPIFGAHITQPFGPSSFVLEPPWGNYAHFHTGVDLAAVMGTPIVAAADGVVVAVGHSGIGYGNYVVIAHGGGIMTLYGHMLETDVAIGARVTRGQRIGREGSTGWSTGPHLHFELRVGNQPIDPLPFLPPIA